MLDKLRSLVIRSTRELGAAGRDEEGQALVEYALILFLVALVVIAILGTLGTAVSSMFNQVTLDF